MRIERQKFRIGELSKQLNVEQFIIRFWEKEFNLKPTRSAGNQRFYSQNDLNKFKTIKSLLYEKGFTIVGAKKQLQSQPECRSIGIAGQILLDSKESDIKHKEFVKQVTHLRKQLSHLQELL